jgi:uncharacterized protein
LDFWAYVVSGFTVGAIVGVTGVGGGSLMTPLLVLMFGVAPTTAVGTDLLYASITKSGGAWVHARRGGIDWRLVRLLAFGSIPASLATIAAIRWLAVDTQSLSHLITQCLGAALILTALSIIFRERIRDWANRRLGFGIDGAPAYWVVITGFTLGLLVTISSVGAGAVGVTALMLLAPALTTSRVVGSDIAHAVPLTLVAGLGHASTGSVDWMLLGSLLIGSLPGIWLGSHLSHRLPERALRALLATLLVLIGGRLAL